MQIDTKYLTKKLKNDSKLKIINEKLYCRNVSLDFHIVIDIYNNYFIKGTKIDRKFLEKYNMRYFGKNGIPCRVVFLLKILEKLSDIPICGNGIRNRPYYIQI